MLYLAMRDATRFIFAGPLARATLSGRVATAPPTSVMNSRRRMPASEDQASACRSSQTDIIRGEECAQFVRSLGLKSQAEWNACCRSKKKPSDIPVAPSQVYADDGWIDLVDWLGAGRRISNWRPFNEARAFVRSLELKNGGE